MTKTQKHEFLTRIYDAYNAGYITADECLRRKQAVEKAYFDAKYGKCDLSDIPS